MIYLLSGNDIKRKNNFLKKLYKDNLPIFISKNDLSKEMIIEQANTKSLFGGGLIIVLDSLIKEESLDFNQEDLLVLKDSKNIFVFLEDKILSDQIKKFKKYSTIEDFSLNEKKKVEKFNVFSIAEAFARRDKIGTWILYREIISEGVSPEEISGIIFWKIKMMILNGNKMFSKDELFEQSSKLVSLYHQAHRGEIDFVVGLEQFILTVLNKS